MEQIHPDSAKIDALGGTAAVARMFNIAQPSVSKWRNTGIPDARLMYLQLIRPDIFPAGQVAPASELAEQPATEPEGQP